jgi:hypothetical protein
MLLEYAAGREQIPLVTILRDEGLSIDDRIWLGCHALPEIRWWCAARAARVHAPLALGAAGLRDHAKALRALESVTDERTSLRAKEAAVAAAVAAWAAAGAAWAAAALAAARRAAAWAAGARAAMWSAAKDAEVRAQLQRLIEMAEATPAR